MSYRDRLAIEILNKIELIIYDFDGVLTDNRVYVDQEGREMVQVNRADGLGISELQQLGIKQLIISTEENPVVTVRARKLGLPCLQGVMDKALALTKYCSSQKFLLERVAYVGNDINDLEAMQISGMSLCPTDAHPRIKQIVTHVLNTKGGGGVARELLDLFINQTQTKD